MAEDPQNKLLECITKEAVMPTKHSEPVSSILIFLQFKSPKFSSSPCLLSHNLLIVLSCQQDKWHYCSCATYLAGKSWPGSGTGHSFGVVFVSRSTHQLSVKLFLSLSVHYVVFRFLSALLSLMCQQVICLLGSSDMHEELWEEGAGAGSRTDAGATGAGSCRNELKPQDTPR